MSAIPSPAPASPGVPLRAVASLFGGNLGTNLVGLAASLLVTRWTQPYEMGLWNFALLVITYLSVLQLGVFNGANRQLPYYGGRGDTDGAHAVAGVMYAWCLLLTGVSVMITGLACLYFWQAGRTDHLAMAAAGGTVLAASWSLQCLTVTYGTTGQFGRLARKGLLVALVGLPLAGLVRAFGYAGLIVRAAALAVLSSVALYAGRPLRVRPRWDRARFVELVRVGFPIWAVGQLVTLFMTLDRLVLADSPEALGHYSIAYQFATMAAMIPTAFNAVLYPQMARRYGERHKALELWTLAARMAVWALAAGAVFALAAWIAIPTFVELLLPAYVPGIPAARWAALTGLALGLSVFGNLFNVLGRQGVYLACVAIGLAVFAGTWTLLTRVLSQPPLVSATQSMLAATLAAATASAAITLWLCRRHDAGRPATALCLHSTPSTP